MRRYLKIGDILPFNNGYFTAPETGYYEVSAAGVTKVGQPMKRALNIEKDITDLIGYSTLAEVIKELTKLQYDLAALWVDPEKVDISIYDGRIEMNYKRPETDHEYEVRIAKEQYIEQQKINEELNLLTKLKAKYETNT